MSELKFCCDRFKNYYECDMEGNIRRIPNIKIIKFKPEHSNSSLVYNKLMKISGNFKFCITTEFYEILDFLKTMFIIIDYCPFCGKYLHNFYKDDAYANEIDGVTFDFYKRKE